MYSQNLLIRHDVKIKISPSILAADFTRLGEDITSVQSADYLHFDVMDGVFVPNLTVGLPVLESVRKFTDMTLDVHLMIASPLDYVARYAKAGADIVTFHIEAETHENTLKAIDEIHSHGKKAGLSIRPNTPYDALIPFLEKLDLVLVMTVEPGFGGQKFIDKTLPKISKLREVIEARSLDCEIEVDGGINPETARLCISAGATVIVAGSDIFNAKDRASRIEKLRRSI